jgi:hypothetical protein
VCRARPAKRGAAAEDDSRRRLDSHTFAGNPGAHGINGVQAARALGVRDRSALHVTRADLDGASTCTRCTLTARR